MRQGGIDTELDPAPKPRKNQKPAPKPERRYTATPGYEHVKPRRARPVPYNPADWAQGSLFEALA